MKLNVSIDAVGSEWRPGKDSVMIVGTPEVCPGSVLDFNQTLLADQPFSFDTNQLQNSLLIVYQFTHNSTGPIEWILSIIAVPQLIEASLWLEIETGSICDPPCQNGGTCSDDFADTCLCQRTGFDGDRCEVPLCQSDCGGRGKCVAPNQCQCDSPWGGPFCVDLLHEEYARAPTISLFREV